MSTHMSAFQLFFKVFLHHCVLAKLATTGIGVKITFVTEILPKLSALQV